MRMYKKIILLLMAAAAPSLLMGQDPPQHSAPFADLRYTETALAYYITLDGKVISGLRIGTRQPDRLFIPEQPQHKRATFRPTEIREYGLEGGSRYLGATYMLDGKQHEVFLEVIIDDPQYAVLLDEQGGEPVFFLQQDNGISRITDNGRELRELMRQQGGQCGKTAEVDKHPMKLTRASVLTMHNAYKSCNTKAISRPIRFGVSAGLCLNRVAGRSQGKIHSDFGIYPSLFVMFPIDANIDILAEVTYKTAKITGKGAFDGQTVYKRQSIFLPVMVRYTATQVGGDWMPFISVGATFDFLTGGGCEIHPQKDMADTMYGVVGEAGVEYRIARRHSLFLSLRYNYAAGKTRDDERRSERYKFPSFNVGFSF